MAEENLNRETEKFDNEQYIPEKPDYEQLIIEILNSDELVSQKKKRLESFHESDLASVFELLPKDMRYNLYALLSEDMVSDVFEYMDNPETYLRELDDVQAAAVLGNMEPDEAVDLLDNLDEDEQAYYHNLIDDEAKRDIDLIQSYGDEEIGHYMTTNLIQVDHGLTVRQVMKELVTQAADNDNISTIYVTKSDGTFYGAIDLKDLIVAREYTSLESLIVHSYPYVYDREKLDDCIEDLKEYSEDSIPVLDQDKHLLGVITSQDMVEIVDEEMGEDYARFAGLTAEEDLQEPLLQSMRKRMPWLIILFVLGLGVSSVVGLFEKVVADLALVVCFQSLILGMSGNVGTQSLGVTIRVLMDESLVSRQKIMLIFKEIRVGLCNGFILSIVAFVFIGVYVYMFKDRVLMESFAISGCVGVALLLAMTVSSFTGTVIPLFFKRVHIDPAVASGPLISTVNDLVAVVIYYGMVWLLLLQVLNLS